MVWEKKKLKTDIFVGLPRAITMTLTAQAKTGTNKSSHVWLKGTLAGHSSAVFIFLFFNASCHPIGPPIVKNKKTVIFSSKALPLYSSVLYFATKKKLLQIKMWDEVVSGSIPGDRRLPPELNSLKLLTFREFTFLQLDQNCAATPAGKV